MALFTTFGELQTMLRAEARMSTNPAVGASANDRHKAIINRVYETLFDSYDWPHLRTVTTRTALSAGSRYVNIPSSLDYNTLESVVAWQGSIPYPLDPGIGQQEYSVFDSPAGERADPPQRYDMRSTDAGVIQLEVWPIPSATDYEIEFTGKRKWQKLVNSIDICVIDDKLVSLFAAEAVLRGINADDADGKLAAAMKRESILRSKGVLPQSEGSTMPRVGVGSPAVSLDRGRASVRVSRS